MIDNPCRGCPDRYPCCHDHCAKPERTQWKQELETIHRNRRQHTALWGYTAEEIRKNRRTR